MKLRNRQSGEIKEFVLFDGKEMQSGLTLENLAREWEDYAPKEPLIKDEKIRKAVRAWAEACKLTHVTYKLASNEFYDADTRGKFAIKFTLIPIEVYLKDGESYTIAELCGEEEE